MERDTLLLRSDLEEDVLSQQERHNAAETILVQAGQLLRQADQALEDIEDQDILGTTIVRASQNLADAVGSLAQQIDQQSEEDRQALAQACLEDAQRNSFLFAEGGDQGDFAESSRHELSTRISSEVQQDLSNLTRDDMMKTIHAAAELLRDVEATLRAIDQDEADEIADVALTVAHLFIMSLQSVHETLTPHDLLTAADGVSGRRSRRSLEPSSQIEILEDEGTCDDTDGVVLSKSETLQKDRVTPSSKKKVANKKRIDRLRVLWPPLGPAVASALNWGKDASAKQPLLAVALGITLWPVAVSTAIIGTPLVLVDGFVQDLYKNFEDGPLIQGVERSAAQLYHSARLTVLCGKLVGKQSLRLVKRQVKRHGGVEKIAQDVGHMAVDRITHPVETVGMAWNAVALGAGALHDTWEHFQNDDEKKTVVQELQQY